MVGDTQHIMNADNGDLYEDLYDAFENVGTDNETKDAVAVISMRDMIETGRDNNVSTSYARLKIAYDKLDIPYIPCYGNNDPSEWNGWRLQ